MVRVPARRAQREVAERRLPWERDVDWLRRRRSQRRDGRRVHQVQCARRRVTPESAQFLKQKTGTECRFVLGSWRRRGMAALTRGERTKVDFADSRNPDTRRACSMVADTLRRSAREASNDVWWRGSQDGCLRDLWTAAGPLDRAATPLCCDGAILLRHADLLPGSVWAIAAQGASADAPSRDGASADAPSREGASADAPSRSDEDVSPCRYCFDAEPRYELVSPCACTGSQAFVHTSCLREWQRLCLTNGDFYKVRSAALKSEADRLPRRACAPSARSRCA